MGLLTALGLDNLASETRFTGSSLSDSVQEAPAIPARVKEHARTFIKPYTEHTLIVKAHEPNLTACKVSPTRDGAGVSFASTNQQISIFRDALKTLDGLLGGLSTALDSRGDKAASKQTGLEFISVKFESDHCTANKVCSATDAANRIYGSKPVRFSSWIPVDDIKKLNNEMKAYNDTNVYDIIEEYLKLVVAWSVETRNPEDMLFISTIKVQTWTYQKHPNEAKQASRGVSELAKVNGFLHYAIVPDGAAPEDSRRMLMYHYDNVVDARTQAPVAKSGGTFKQILKADAERKTRMTFNSRMEWPLVYYKA